MQSRGKGVCKLLLAAGVVGLISAEDGDALAPAPGDEVIEFDQTYGDPELYGEDVTEQDVEEEVEEELEDTDPYAEAPIADVDVDFEYADPPEEDAYATPPDEEEDAYATPPYEEDPYAVLPDEEDGFVDGYGYGAGYEYGTPPEDTEDAYGPEEVAGPEDAYGPEEVEGPVDIVGVAAADELTSEEFSANPAVDYIPGFDNAVPSQNIGGNAVADQNECAAVCLADPACNAASFYLDATDLGGNNCWTKTLSVPCEVPVDAVPDPNAVLLLQTTDCAPVAVEPFPAPEPEEMEAPGLGPMLAPDMGPLGMAPRDFVLGMAPGPAAGSLAELGYFAYAGADYVSTDMPPNLVSVTNTDAPSSLETDMVACAMRCDATPMCNAASYYADPSQYLGNNCWLKILGDSCELPADAQSEIGATLLMKQDTCLELGAIAPGALEPSMAPMDMMPALVPGVAPGAVPVIVAGPAGVPVAVDPATDRGIGLASPPTETIDSTDSTDNTADPVTSDSTVEDAGTAATVRSAAAAVAAVAAIALLA